MKGWTIDAGEWKPGDKARIAFFCDPHIEIEGDNSSFQRAMSEAVSDGCRIWLNGDISDWIYHIDKRYMPSREQLRKKEGSPEDDIELNALIDNAEDYLRELLKPYAEHIDAISYGNHEVTAVKKYLTSPTRRVCKDLGIRSGAYRQLVKYRWRMKGEDGSYQSTRTLTCYIHHGKSGVAVMNKGILALREMYLGAMADVYIVGHGHRGVIDPADTFYYMDREGNIRRGNRKGMQIPGFNKGESKSGIGYEDTFYRSTPTGYGIVEVDFGRNGISTECRIKIKE